MEYVLLAALAAGWIAAYLLIKYVFRIEFKGVKLYPLGFIVRSERSVEIFDKAVAKAPSLIKVASDLGIALGFGMMAFAVYVLSKNLGTYLFAPSQVGPQNIVIPLVVGVTIRLEHLPYMLVALGIVLVTHEGMHGVIARLEGIKLKSTGLFLFYLFPGGFVEPDEEELRRASSRVKARIAAGGSLANLAVGILVILLMAGIFIPSEAGLVVLETDGSVKGIEVNDVIYSVNGVPVNRNTLYQNISASDSLVIQTSRGTQTYKLKQPINMPLAWILRSLGITRIDYYFPARIRFGSPQTEYAVYRVFWWTQLIAVNVAVFNMLPIYFLDGNMLVISLLESKLKNEKALSAISYGLTALCLFLIVANMGFTFKTFGLVRI
ncbi:MAG: site-2 protease family protein [Thaumarchaeota archaeon]|nr:site-2 protease family protein [Nitrososphaerota archaeon]